MSVPRARLLELQKLQCQIFSTTFNPQGVRTGNKILRQRLKGPALASYYPRRVVTFQDLQKKLNRIGLLVEDEREIDRQEHLEGVKSRGKGAPKKKKGPAELNARGKKNFVMGETRADMIIDGRTFPQTFIRSGICGLVKQASHRSDEFRALSPQDLTITASLKKSSIALTTSKFMNQMHHESIAGVGHHPTDNLLTKLSEQNHQQGIERVMSEATQMPPRTLDHQSSCSSLPIGPATETFAPTAPTTRSASATPNESQRSADEQQQPVGTPLSPHATEFTSAGTPWKAQQPLAPEGQTYLPATEPLNYRRLLDRNVTCDWKYIVDKIVCNNDQQASIFLQQKLKVGTPQQKYDIVEAIVAQAYPLMVNRFGNFLVQRCFEHGSPEQVVKIAEAIRGNTLNLSMDPFGCHVVQKAFDSVPEDYKAIMVHELLRRIPETVIHRYACHVWQKLFELRWTESPPQIMKYVNEALRGMWHEVALGETGSLVVQNIFENCLEEDKRPCIEEVLANIDIVAHGQFGNWCIQHICEHGAPADRSRAIDHVIRYAAEYSMDQFASKVVEKCLKIGGPDFLGRYLDRVCEGRVDRPRIPLIDIASDQYGNYLIQYILTHANPQHREIVAAHIRKHMVSLRGSKFGSRVGMLCTNHAVATRPGPGFGPPMGGGRMPPAPRYNGGYR
ncbi:hypothetical protein P8C59_006933 [Phyllachora maydis]|uniref:PUM-HD domain-containing protein n=1 Tax=Phyllachora maydis TaxID=1825666 RepID=A0AAD9MG30_9PEZI|nr:hypothetical protein P8C59_006933 [Phyllachora maydis]